MSIFTSRLANDWYKFTMSAVVRKYYPNTIVGYRFINRNSDFPLARYIDLGRLREELEAYRDLKFSMGEIAFLRNLGIFGGQDLTAWKAEQLPEVSVERIDDQLEIRTEGLWHSAMAWECPILAITTELVSKALCDEAGLTDADTRRIGHQKLDDVIAGLKAHPDIRFAPFGLRRHFSKDWEYEATERLVMEVPEQIVGISNVELARAFEYNLSGTIAHEYFMVLAAIHIGLDTPNPLVMAMDQAMDYWEAEYSDKWSGGMLCTIPDTFGTDFFLKHFTAERAMKWRTHKQDSGDPKVFVDKLLLRLTELGQDPMLHRINHTDGLVLDKVIDLQNYCRGRYRCGFGWGTTLSNNVGIPTHSLVIKPDWVMVDGVKVPCGKLSDNLSKATGHPAMVARLKKEAGYTNTFSELQTV